MQPKHPTPLIPFFLVAIVMVTTAMFFVTQRFKQEPPPLENAWATKNFSPNRDNVKDIARFGFVTKKSDKVSVSITTSDGSSVRDLVKNQRLLTKQSATFRWDGKTDKGTLANDGRYWVRVAFHRQAKAFVLAQVITKDTVAPTPRILSIRPEKNSQPELLPRQDGKPAVISYRTSGQRPKISVFRTDTTPVQRIIGPIAIPKALQKQAGKWTWDGKVDGEIAPDGTYLVVLSVRDRAGNLGTSIKEPWPKITYGKRFPRRAGITIRSFAVQGPSSPIFTGKKILAAVTAPNIQYRWKLTKYGSKHAVLQGKGKGSQLLQIKAPKQANGIYLVTVKTKQRQAQTPVFITRKKEKRVLVVIPNTSWQASNPVDDEGDGIPNTLDNGMPITIGRPYAGSGTPKGLAESASILKTINKLKLQYTVTTDLALGTTSSIELKKFSGIVIAGSARWITNQAGQQLLRFARQGGTVTVTGKDVLKRSAQLRQGRLKNPSQPTAEDLFGIETKSFQKSDFAITATTDRINLFRRTAGRLQNIKDAEEILLHGEDTSLETEAVTEDGEHRILVALQVGKGRVIRIGLGQFANQLSKDTDLQALIRRVWELAKR